MNRSLFFVLCSLLLGFAAMAQESYNFARPIRASSSLNANFGELRNNHFHSGIDYATNRETGKTVYSIAGGYVSRIAVSPKGYGKALYIMHPESGLTSVYGHLEAFLPPIDSLVRARQYELKSFAVDFEPDKRALPVKYGQPVALSGNSGSSGGPHLHFEVRDTKTEEIIDPLRFGFGIEDNRRPTIRAVAVYPLGGVVNGKAAGKLKLEAVPEPGNTRLKNAPAITAWGQIGFGVKAYDYIDKSARAMGIASIQLFVDGKPVFAYRIDRFAFDETRYVNSFIDYEDWKRYSSFFMKSYVELGNRLRLFKPEYEGRGYVIINEERDYAVRYEVSDSRGNKASLAFTVKGVKADVPAKSKKCEQSFAWNKANVFERKGFRAELPADVLYTDLCADYERTASTRYLSDVHRLQDSYTPLHDTIDIYIPFEGTYLSREQQGKLLAVKLNGTARPDAVGGRYERGALHLRTREFGAFAVAIDTIAPNVVPVKGSRWRFKITDNLSGIGTYNGYVDGKWVLFEYDAKNDLLFAPSSPALSERKLRLEVTDKVGNRTVYENKE